MHHNQDIDTRALMSDAKFYEAYSRWNDEKDRYETWDEAVSRVMGMHREFYDEQLEKSPELSRYFDEAESLYKLKYVLGAQRALQFGGEQLLKNHMKMYNCLSTYADRPAFFNEYFWSLLCGAGVGFSVQTHHVAKLPDVGERKKQAKGYTVPDSIEGWADALAVLMSSYFVDDVTHPEYRGRKVYFDLSQIRPKGAKISGGFKAPGPEPLRRALDRIEYMLQGVVLAGRTRLKPIEVYDIAMHAADAVLAGGVRRSATICLFSADDEDMIKAKTGNWFADNPQRARSNNSAVIVRSEISREVFSGIMESIKQYGEPGFVFVESTEHAFNPCVEIGMLPSLDGVSGFQGCNLSEINGGVCTTEEEFYKACRGAAILGTLQAGYTHFTYVSDVTRKIFEREALIGVSLTGWMNNPKVLLNDEVQRKGAEIVLQVNEEVAALLGINPAARATCCKPSGNASVLLQTASGVHPEHSPRYLRNVQMSKDSEVAQLIAEVNPYMVEDSVWSKNGTDYVISFPVIPDEQSMFKDDLVDVDFLKVVRQIQQNWVEYGTRSDRCVDKTLRHNVSNTVVVKDWKSVEEYVFTNKNYFAGISFIAGSGDKDYNQAPMTSIPSNEELVTKYGRASFFAAGLVVDTYRGFNDLWEATMVASMPEEHRGELSDLRADWIRRFHKFAKNYFNGNLKQAEYCLKDVYLLHRWTKIEQNYTLVNFKDDLKDKKFIDVDTIGSQACAGGVACEISWN